ncbi:nucleotide sugar dehydrogenase [Salibacterium aidingense]|uniref:nucleotide sugar dehydrogenase n=1 Tax=Salibacterium aidingense TaxID=384933 RepID=UPI003BC3FFC4
MYTGIIGLGYVGLPLAVRFAEAGCEVAGFDIDENKVSKLNDGISYINGISSTRVESIRTNGSFTATADFAVVERLDALILCVPTPLNKQKEPDLSFVEQTLKMLSPYLRNHQLLSLESTTYPGTTEEVVVPFVESLGFTVGEDFYIVYSPEREDPGNKTYTTKSIPKIIGGVTPSCLQKGMALYQKAIETVVPVRSTRTAELTKLLENIYRSVNIGLVNELKMVADRMDIDIYEVIQAASTKPFGYVPFYPGPGLGGHCIPIDPFYLTWKAREYDVQTRFIELAGEINTLMPEWVVQKLYDALNEQGKPIKGSKILVLGLAYKKNVDDTRESPSVKLIDLLQTKGAEVSYSDPFVPVFPEKRDYHFDMDSIALTHEKLQSFDCVLLATDHDAFDYDMIQKNSRMIVDTRGKWNQKQQNIIKA